MKSNYLIRRKYLLWFAPISLSVLLACDPMEHPDSPEVRVSTEKSTYKVGEAVTFHIEGNPDIISFYSGEPGNDYAFVATDRLEWPDIEMSFNTYARSQTAYMANGSRTTTCQIGQFHVHISTDLDFTDCATAADSTQRLQDATWTEISDRFNIRETECNSTQATQTAGTTNISDLIVEGQPMHVGFQYINRPYNEENGGSNIWRFEKFSMLGITQAGSTEILGQNAGNWRFVRINGGSSRSAIEASRVTIRGDERNQEHQELWCVSVPLYLDEKVNLGYDKAIAIKSAFESPLSSYTHIYTSPGVYTVTFVAANTNVYDRKEVVRQIQITIEE